MQYRMYNLYVIISEYIYIYINNLRVNNCIGYIGILSFTSKYLKSSKLFNELSE